MRTRWFGAALFWVLCTLPGGLVAVPTAVAQEPAPNDVNQEIGLPEVYVRVALVRAELERIRIEMGMPRSAEVPHFAEHVLVRQVYFQAQTLFQKADRLAFEQTRERADMPAAPEGEIRPSDVWDMVNGALERLQRVKAKIGIPEQSTPIPAPPETTPTEAFQEIRRADRQLSLLLDRTFSTSDTYQTVTSAISYTSGLLSQFPGATRSPDAPAFERGRSPADVFRRLVQCHMLLYRIIERSGLPVIDVQVEPQDFEGITPSDANDLATLLVSELAHLHGQLTHPPPVRTAYPPGRKFPSHVYQRVGILEAQLTELAQLVEEHPDWLRR